MVLSWFVTPKRPHCRLFGARLLRRKWVRGCARAGRPRKKEVFSSFLFCSLKPSIKHKYFTVLDTLISNISNTFLKYFIPVREKSKVGAARLNPNRTGGWYNVQQEIHLSLILLAIVHLDGNQTIFSSALLVPAPFQHPARLRERTLN